jgi:Tfp pilus assembly protein PilV
MAALLILSACDVDLVFVAATVARVFCARFSVGVFAFLSIFVKTADNTIEARAQIAQAQTSHRAQKASLTRQHKSSQHRHKSRRGTTRSPHREALRIEGAASLTFTGGCRTHYAFHNGYMVFPTPQTAANGAS